MAENTQQNTQQNQPKLMDLNLVGSMQEVSAEASQMIGNLNQNIEETAKNSSKVPEAVAWQVAAALSATASYKSFQLMRNRNLTTAVTENLSEYLLKNKEARTFLEKGVGQETKNMMAQIDRLEEQLKTAGEKDAKKLNQQVKTLKNQFISQVKPEEFQQISNMIDKAKPERVAKFRDNVIKNRQMLYEKHAKTLFDKMPDSPEKANLVNGLSKGEYTFRNGAVVDEKVIMGADKFTAQAMKDYRDIPVRRWGVPDFQTYFEDITKDKELVKQLQSERREGNIRIENGKIVDESGLLKKNGLTKDANKLWKEKYSKIYTQKNEAALNAFMKDFTGTPEEAAKVMEGLKSGAYKFEGGQLVTQKTVMSASDVAKHVGPDANIQIKAYETVQKQVLDRSEKWLAGAENVKTASDMVAKDFQFVEEYSKAMAAGDTKGMASVLKKMGASAKMSPEQVEKIIKEGNFEGFKKCYERASSPKAAGHLKTWSKNLYSDGKKLLTRHAGKVAIGLAVAATYAEFEAINKFTENPNDAEAISNLQKTLGKDLGIKNLKQYSPEEKRRLIDWAIDHSGNEEDKKFAQEIKNNGYDIVVAMQQRGMLTKQLMVSNDEVAKAYADVCGMDVKSSIEAMALKKIEDAYNNCKENDNQQEDQVVISSIDENKPEDTNTDTDTDTNTDTDTDTDTNTDTDTDSDAETDTDSKDETDKDSKDDETKGKKVSKDEIFKVIEIEKKGDQATEEEKKEREDILTRLQANGVDETVPEEIKAELRKANLLPKEGEKEPAKPGNDTGRTTVPPVVRGGGGTVTIPGGGGTTVVPGASSGGATSGGTVLGPDGKPVKTDDLPMAIAQAEQKSFWSKYGTWILGFLGIGGAVGLGWWLVSREKKKTKQAKAAASEAQSTVNELTDKVAELEKQAAENAANSGTTQDTANSGTTQDTGNSGTAQDSGNTGTTQDSGIAQDTTNSGTTQDTGNSGTTQDSGNSSGGTLSDFSQPVLDTGTADTAVALINSSNTRLS